MILPQNPYVAGNPVGGSPAFIGRADVLREVTRLLANPNANAIVLYGQRRIGKTSILQQLVEQLPNKGAYHPVLFDLQDKAAWPLERVLQALAREISYSLSLPDPDDIDFSRDDGFRNKFIPQIQTALPKSSSLVLLFDEFDVLDSPSADQAGAAFFPYLRQLMGTDRQRLQFAFVIGRKPDDLTTLALSVFKEVKSKRVSLLTKKSAARLIHLSQENETLNWTTEAVDEIWTLTNGHPYLTQQLCEIIWNEAYDAGPDDIPTITPAQVQAAVPETIESSVHALEWIWNGLFPPERYVTSVLAQAGPRPINQAELEQRLVESGVRVVISELQNAPQILQEWDLIEPAEGGYRFRVELLRRWIAEKKPVSRVQEELDHIEPVANNLYQAGYGFYQTGQLDQAINLLRQALGINPNHLQAGLLLAQILLAQGELSEAIALLEIIYEYNPGAARPRLVQALLDQAEEIEAEDDKLSLYDRVLTLIPNQSEAVERRQAVWKQRGDDALAKGILEDSLKAYQQAGLGDKVAEVEDRLRAQELANLQTKAEDLEKQKQYDEALALIEQLAAEFPDEGDWEQAKTRLERILELDATYRQALGALQENDREQGQKLLVQVVTLDANYEETLQHLLKAVKGTDVFKLQNQLAKEKEARKKAEADANRAIEKTQQIEITLSELQSQLLLLQNQLAKEKEARKKAEADANRAIRDKQKGEKALSELQSQSTLIEKRGCWAAVVRPLLGRKTARWWVNAVGIVVIALVLNLVAVSAVLGLTISNIAVSSLATQELSATLNKATPGGSSLTEQDLEQITQANFGVMLQEIDIILSKPNVISLSTRVLGQNVTVEIQLEVVKGVPHIQLLKPSFLLMGSIISNRINQQFDSIYSNSPLQVESISVTDSKVIWVYESK